MASKMSSKGLTALAIKNAKAKSRAYKLSDRDGLYLLVTPSGRKYWRSNYRYGGRQKTIAYGVWPDVGLGMAREKHVFARKQLANGKDPAHEAKLAKIAKAISAANSFRAVGDEWLAKRKLDGLSPVTLKKTRWLLDKCN